jgi:hypothetical protein
MYEVEYTIDEIEDLKFYRKHERQLIVDEIDDSFPTNRPMKPAIENDCVPTASRSSNSG